MEKIFRCKNCVTLSTRPRITFTGKTCNACQNNKNKKEIDWDKRKKEFIRIIFLIKLFDSMHFFAISPPYDQPTITQSSFILLIYSFKNFILLWIDGFFPYPGRSGEYISYSGESFFLKFVQIRLLNNQPCKRIILTFFIEF